MVVQGPFFTKKIWITYTYFYYVNQATLRRERQMHGENNGKKAQQERMFLSLLPSHSSMLKGVVGTLLHFNKL